MNNKSKYLIEFETQVSKDEYNYLEDYTKVLELHPLTAIVLYDLWTLKEKEINQDFKNKIYPKIPNSPIAGHVLLHNMLEKLQEKGIINEIEGPITFDFKLWDELTIKYQDGERFIKHTEVTLPTGVESTSNPYIEESGDFIEQPFLTEEEIKFKEIYG